MTICPAVPTDAHILTGITKAAKAYWGYSKEQLAIWSDELTIQPAYVQEYLVFKFVTNAEIRAYYSLHPNEPKRFKLENMFVLPKYIGTGIGKKLLEHACRKSLEQGAQFLWLESDPHATKFYEKHGFEIIGQQASSIPGRYLPIMELPLQKA
jgi:GNAT superfamily N-acetyltransferase